MDPPPPAAERRRSRRASALKARNYDESILDDLSRDYLDTSRKRNRTLKERQKETDVEAMIALSLGFPVDALLESEVSTGVLSSAGEQNDYIVVRNHILARWRANVRSWLLKSQIRETVHKDYDHLISAAYEFLSVQGYINFGVAHAIRSDFSDGNECGSVIIVGAGLAGLAAARQLLSFGFKVLVIEGRDRPGGRVYTSKIGRVGNLAVVDLGGSVLTGIHANPLGVLARQLGIPLHKIRDSCPLYWPNGRVVDEKLDGEVNSVFNKLLEKATEARKALGEWSDGISLGSAIEKLWKFYGVASREDERELLDWHLANLEYANAGWLSDLSLAHWDQDDPFEMDGDHCFLAGGNWRLINALCEDVPILYRKTVTRIEYGDSGVEVAVSGGQLFRADMVLCTVPLGVLKNENIKFDPELPSQKLGAIKRLGFGLLNKVAMLFPHAFWGDELDTFGCLNKDREKRGEFFLFYCYHTVSGGALLTALVAGKAALSFEHTDPVALLHNVLGVLRGIYKPRGIEVPEPIQTICTKWGSDPLCHGSYSHIRVGSSGSDYDILAECVGGSLFFAGEATNRHYPATMHGAYLSGLREASRILHTWQSRNSKNNEPKKPLQKSLRICGEILADLFRQPDLSFGNFLFVSDPFNAEDPKVKGLMRIAFDNNVNQDTAQSLQVSDQCNQPLHLYAILSREQALQMPGRTDNEIKNYWNTRIKRRQRAGLALYPPEIQCQIAAKAQQGRIMDVPKHIRMNNCVSQSFPAPNNTLFNNIGSSNNNNADYLIGNFNCSPQQQLQSPGFPVKMELPIAQMFHGYSDNQKLLSQPPLLGRGSCGLFDDLCEEPRGTGELFDEGLLANPLWGGCGASMAEPLLQQLPLSSSFKYPVMDLLSKPDNSNFFTMGAVNQPLMENHDVSQLLEMNPVPTTPMPTEKLLSDWYESAPLIGVNENDIKVKMKWLASDIAHDRNYGSSSFVNRN